MLGELFKRITSNWRRTRFQIEVAGLAQAFDGLEEFSEFLDLRLELPTESLDKLAALDQYSLTREVRHVSRAYRNAVDIMVRGAETGLPVLRLWHQLDISRVPDDHDWPSILFAVGNADRYPDSFHRNALAHYIRYLDARRGFVEHLWRESGRVGQQADQPVVPLGMRSIVGQKDRMTTTRHSVYARLPRRRSIVLEFGEQPGLTLYLAHNRFVLRRESGLYQLLGQDGVSYTLLPGRNTVGRSSQCNIHLKSEQSDISREHLQIEITTDGQVSVMDISSRGTYVPPEILPSRREFIGTNTDTLH